jgi:hypothetical protein
MISTINRLSICPDPIGLIGIFCVSANALKFPIRMVVNITTSFESRNACLRATHRQAQNTQKRILFGIGLPAISSF